MPPKADTKLRLAPGFVANNISDRLVRNPVLLCHRAFVDITSRISGANLTHDVPCQASLMMLFSARPALGMGSSPVPISSRQKIRVSPGIMLVASRQPLWLSARIMQISAGISLRMQTSATSRTARQSLRVKACKVPITFRHAALTGSIGHVVMIGSKKEVIGPATRLNIAAVKDRHPIRDRAKCEFPRQTMSGSRFSSELDFAVSVVASPLGPRPAAIHIGPVNKLPEILRRVTMLTHPMTPLALVKWGATPRSVHSTPRHLGTEPILYA
jgi:hypothetical protein